MKVLIIGLDAASPELVFEDFRKDLPNIDEMISSGVYGSLRSCDPPITIPAWAVMTTGVNPGHLGLYGFRHREKSSYTDFYIATSYSIKNETVWDKASKQGLKSQLVGVPPTYPPKPVNGNLVSCFITPDATKQFTYPNNLKTEIETLIGEYMFDVKFRTEQRDNLIKDLYKMTEKRFKVIQHLLNKRWDFFMFVEIGLDRIQHAFWKYYDKSHKRHIPDHPYQNVIKDYYQHLDQQMGEILKKLDNDTVILTVSDHGAKRMDGAFCINEWLIREGWMKLKKTSNSVVDLEKADVDWARTKAWGWGGYYARIFFNVRDREPTGVIDRKHFEEERNNLTDSLSRIEDPDGRRMDMKVYKPEDLYPTLNGDYPDLMVYFDDLYWRSAGTIGHNMVYLPENDKGPDDAMHAHDGIYILYDKNETFNKRRKDANILDIAPTILKTMGLPSSDLKGRVIV